MKLDRPIRIAVDVMGGDHAPTVEINGCLSFIKKKPNVELILMGDETKIHDFFKSRQLTVPSQIHIQHASEVIQMTDSPTKVLRQKRKSSMRLVIEAVHKKEADACVSSGNTGALMVLSRFVLNMLEGIDRPAIVTSLPTHIPHRPVHLLDLGANVDSTPAHLEQLAIMGSALAQGLGHTELPKVGLLNIGREDNKGNELVKETHKILLNHPSIQYVGFVEGDDIFQGDVDVVVCDGFVGNVLLKTIEGLTHLIGKFTQQAFRKSFWNKVAGIFARPVIKSLWNDLNPSEYNGAVLIGLKGIVVKSHGKSSVDGFIAALEKAYDQVAERVIDRIMEKLQRIMEQSV